MPRIKGLPEGKSPARHESRTAEPITLDAFKAFKESIEKQDQRFKEQALKMNQRFDELTETMDVIDASKNTMGASSIANSPFKDGMRCPSK